METLKEVAPIVDSTNMGTREKGIRSPHTSWFSTTKMVCREKMCRCDMEVKKRANWGL